MKTRDQGPRIGALLEQTLGHVSHGRNIQETLAQVEHATVSCRELPYEPAGIIDRLPPKSNWTMRSSLAARGAVKELEQGGPLDALFVHTHVPATLLGSTMLKVPTVVSIDATPRQIDSLGDSYKHDVQSEFIENAKWRMHTRCFRRASSLVAWSRWAADSLVTDYGVERDRIEVIPPGVVTSQWIRPEPRTIGGDTVRILFVGGDFERKGGELLVTAVERLRSDPEVQRAGLAVELHLVTTANVPSRPGVHVHRGLTPNSPELIELFHRCDVFALPTRGDCTPLVLAEAATAGLPSVATDVGAISETVIDGVTGHLVEPTAESVEASMRRLVLDAEHRLKLGRLASEHAARTMDSEKNALRLLDGVVESARNRRTRNRVILTVSGDIAPDREEETNAGKRPLADFHAIAKASNATLLDWTKLRDDGSILSDLIRRTAGDSAALAYHIYRRRREVDVVITDGEQIGLPLAALLRFRGKRAFRHIMIGHRLSPSKKTVPTKLLGLSGGVDEVLVYSSSQREVADELFPGEDCRVRLIDFMVDTEFFAPTRDLGDRKAGTRPRLCTAGREFRDYPTLIEAVRDLDVDVTIASASPWSKRDDNAHSVELPPNVEVTALSQYDLRTQLDEADILIMPLLPTDFQAGITTILEAMAMERPVICTATEGQTDVIEDNVTGRYVAPGDVEAMKSAIVELISDWETATEMGKRGREVAQQRADVRVYANLFAGIVQDHLPAESDRKNSDVEDGDPSLFLSGPTH